MYSMKGFIRVAEGEGEEAMKEETMREAIVAVEISRKVVLEEDLEDQKEEDLLLEDHMRVDQEDQLEEMVEDHNQAHCCRLSVTRQRWRMPCLDMRRMACLGMRRMACLDTESK